jgi:hypothetical protein
MPQKKQALKNLQKILIEKWIAGEKGKHFFRCKEKYPFKPDIPIAGY